MGWAKLDDGFLTHPKALAAGKDGRALFIAGLLYAAGHLTDGLITASVLPLVAAAAEVRARPTAATLVAVGLWEQVPDGWAIHDYHDWNRAADDEREKRRKRAEAGRRGGLKSRPSPTEVEAKPEANVEAKPEAKPEANEEANVEAGAKQNGTPSPYPYLDDLHGLKDSRSYAPSTPPPETVDNSEPRLIAEQAYALIADDRIAKKPPTGDPDIYRRSTIAGLRKQHHDQALRYLHLNPNLTPGALRDLLEPPPAARPATHEPGRRVDIRTEEQTAALLDTQRAFTPPDPATISDLTATARNKIRRSATTDPTTQPPTQTTPDQHRNPK